ncbi:hypothetical protein FHE72_21665 [Rossellomorea vietnamensis]|uniref:Stage II sporulation protein M n=1 Tax=Rossellomorea vietnamensis TaxID=218284 RepID=A0A6I6UUJ4_9BACI|nr:stage II sporulation protein M [Rossellomorea vietnamensis]QHE63301.1 hypothetical protein FHE72_21665 [Rossellomorea vietnamensis]
MKKRVYIPILALSIGLLYGMFSSQFLLDLDLTPKKVDLTFGYIFQNNVSIILFMFLGILSFGFVTLIILLINGVSVGILISEFINTDMAGFVFWNTFPHGSIEVVGFLLAAIGDMYIIRFLWEWLRRFILKQNNSSPLSFSALQRGLSFNVLAICLITVAAVVEVYII